MSLMKCGECGSAVSDKAAACPKCGAPASEFKRAPKTRPWAWITLGVLVALFAFAAYEKPDTDTHAAAQQAAAAQPTAPAPAEENPTSAPNVNAQPAAAPVAVSAAELIADYSANEVSADLKYKGKALQVQGYVLSIDKDFMGDPGLRIAPNLSDDGLTAIYAKFGKEDIDRLSKIQKGQSITVTCRGEGMILSAPMLQCGPQALQNTAAIALEQPAATVSASSAPPSSAQSQPIAAAPDISMRPGWCNKAATQVENMICSNPELWPLDFKTFKLFLAARKASDDRSAVNAQQLAWLKNRRNACDSVSCLEDAYKERITDLGGQP